MRIVQCIALLAAVACSSESADTSAGDPVTQQQRDSATGASALPGAGVVRGAIGVTDAAEARRAMEDSLSR